jgi:hypothetical protein
VDAKNGRSRVVRVALLTAQGIFSLAGIAFVVAAIWQNNNTLDGHRYWPFMDLFWLLVLGCAFMVLALNTVVWLRVLEAARSKSSLVVTLVLLVILSPGATIVLAVIALLIAAGIPG